MGCLDNVIGLGLIRALFSRPAGGLIILIRLLQDRSKMPHGTMLHAEMSTHTSAWM